MLKRQTSGSRFIPQALHGDAEDRKKLNYLMKKARKCGSTVTVLSLFLKTVL